MKKYTNVIAVLGIALIATAGLTAQEEGGGQSGADFLLNVPVSRADAMGGIMDGQGNSLEGILLNPAVLMLDPEFRLLVNIAPLPNDVTNSQLSVGVPIADGMVAASAQLLSAGDFTYVNASGQASGTVTLFDAAASAGYAQYVAENLAVGGSAKVVYRSLGDDTAFAVGTDLGAAWWFETPHVGQRPKPPTRDELDARLNRDLNRLEGEREKRTREAAGEVADLRGDEEKLEEQLADIEADLADAAPDDDTTKLEERKAATEQTLGDVRTQLEEAEAAAADDLAAVEAWYKDAVAEARAAHQARLADLREVERERARLFEVVDDPESTLAPEDIDKNIEDAIDRTREFLADRRAALTAANREYAATRRARRDEIEDQITHYEEQIAEVVGPEATRLAARIEQLQEQLAGLEAAEGENDDQIKSLRSQISQLQKELDELEGDPWVRRLRRRIEQKQKAIAEIDADIEEHAGDTDEQITELEQEAERAIVRFEALRETLQNDLRRATLRKELDLIDARNERATDRALARYEAEEQALYQRLLAAMYDNEEKIFNARLETARLDSQNREFIFASTLTDEREAVEDDFAFEERFLERQLAELKRAEPTDEDRVAEVQDELSALREAHETAMDEFEAAEDSFDAEERARLSGEIDAILAERRKVRLIYLQTDDPYQNTAITLAIRNLGTDLTFVETGYPMPRSAAVGLSYGAVNTEMHRATLSTEVEMPLYGEPTLDDLQIGVGAEYVFADFASLRAGYAFGSLDRSFSVGFAVDFALGFTSYAIDYAFRPLPDYGLQHTVGVSIAF